MKALSVRQPWAWAIAHGGKDVENRTWQTWTNDPIAIHASARWDSDGAWDRRVIDAAHQDQRPGGFFDPPLRVETDIANGRTLRLLPDERRFVLGAVIAVAKIALVCTGQRGCGCSSWAVQGQYHWRLAHVQPLDEPVPCKGRLSLWDLPEDVEVAVKAQLAAAPSPQAGETS